MAEHFSTEVIFVPTNSERSEECIDFTMIITSRNNAPISNYGGVLKKIEKNKKKNDGKTGIFIRKTSFRPNRLFFMVVIQKLITVNT
ncbi:Uncharacterized protein FWK35_00032452 [Aphis craccivora]|uniref:Uncharacterized protein n=1 Tax=Aphis craccivora TaxID=307492 RepID=A0A6G0WBC8_APHCR|nr:Uncharacterized protein FWK35_00032452 [Aphis craccivora]